MDAVLIVGVAVVQLVLLALMVLASGRQGDLVKWLVVAQTVVLVSFLVGLGVLTGSVCWFVGAGLTLAVVVWNAVETRRRHRARDAPDREHADDRAS